MPRSPVPTSSANETLSPVAGSVCELPDEALLVLPVGEPGAAEPAEPEEPGEDDPDEDPVAPADEFCPEPVTTTVPCMNGWILQK